MAKRINAFAARPTVDRCGSYLFLGLWSKRQRLEHDYQIFVQILTAPELLMKFMGSGCLKSVGKPVRMKVRPYYVVQ